MWVCKRVVTHVHFSSIVCISSVTSTTATSLSSPSINLHPPNIGSRNLTINGFRAAALKLSHSTKQIPQVHTWALKGSRCTSRAQDVSLSLWTSQYARDARCVAYNLSCREWNLQPKVRLSSKLATNHLQNVRGDVQRTSRLVTVCWSRGFFPIRLIFIAPEISTTIGERNLQSFGHTQTISGDFFSRLAHLPTLTESNNNSRKRNKKHQRRERDCRRLQRRYCQRRKSAGPEGPLTRSYSKEKDLFDDWDFPCIYSLGRSREAILDGKSASWGTGFEPKGLEARPGVYIQPCIHLKTQLYRDKFLWQLPKFKHFQRLCRWTGSSQMGLGVCERV